MDKICNKESEVSASPEASDAENFIRRKLDVHCWHIVYIGLGSNIGNRESYLNDALQLLNNDLSKVTRVSSFYSTKPVGYTAQEDFLNCAAELKTLLTPPDLLRFLQDIETRLKRKRIIKWGPRTIDLDILLYDDAIVMEETLVIPHPRMHERLFVLVPLSEIAPCIVHPLLGQSIIELKEQLAAIQSL
jgi:dihydroneopterin aldolase/2-amino-4-hydroxy-6-hydroxymethyldihydropteridine diphosphokinase